MVRKNKAPKRELEWVDPTPISLPVGFAKPPTLAEQIARYLNQAERLKQEAGEESPDEADDFGSDEEDEQIYSPHEVVFDELLNREIPRWQKEHFEKQRKEFDNRLMAKVVEDRKAAQAAEKAKQQLAAERRKKKEQPRPDESDEDDN